jgi:hypothetical protein
LHKKHDGTAVCHKKYFCRRRSDPSVALAIIPAFAPQLDDSFSESSFTICKNAKTLGSSACFSNDDSVVQFEDDIYVFCLTRTVDFMPHDLWYTLDEYYHDQDVNRVDVLCTARVGELLLQHASFNDSLPIFNTKVPVECILSWPHKTYYVLSAGEENFQQEM